MPVPLRRSSGPAALVVAVLALAVALGGTSYAAVTLAKNSVGAKQLKNGAVTSAKVKDGSIGRADLAAGAVVAGPAGPQGPAGPSGAPGPRGPGATRVTLTDEVGGGASTTVLGTVGILNVSCNSSSIFFQVGSPDGTNTLTAGGTVSAEAVGTPQGLNVTAASALGFSAQSSLANAALTLSIPSTGAVGQVSWVATRSGTTCRLAGLLTQG